MTTEPLETLDIDPAPEAPAPGRLERFLSTRVGRFVKFGVVGGSGVVVNLLVFEIVFLSLNTAALAETTAHALANTAGILVSIFTNFLLNDSWTWGDRLKGTGRDWSKRVARYYLTCSIAGVVQLVCATLSFRFLLDPLGWVILGVDPAPRLSVLLGIAAGIAINFPISHLWAFKDAEPS